MASTGSEDGSACLQVAIDLLERSDSYAATEPRLARQYARQAYELGHRSRSLRRLIAQERIRMVVQNSDRCRITQILDDVPTSQNSRLRYAKKAGLMILLILAASLLSSTPVGDLTAERVNLAARFIDAPL
jgi:ribosomal protein L18